MLEDRSFLTDCSFKKKSLSFCLLSKRRIRNNEDCLLDFWSMWLAEKMRMMLKWEQMKAAVTGSA